MTFERFGPSYGHAGGAGGNRTLVQTRNQLVFYMLSLSWLSGLARRKATEPILNLYYFTQA